MMDVTERRRDRQRARLQAAERETFAHDGVEATSEPLVLADPRMTTRVLRVGSGSPTVLLHGGALARRIRALAFRTVRSPGPRRTGALPPPFALPQEHRSGEFGASQEVPRTLRNVAERSRSGSFLEPLQSYPSPAGPSPPSSTTPTVYRPTPQHPAPDNRGVRSYTTPRDSIPKASSGLYGGQGETRGIRPDPRSFRPESACCVYRPVPDGPCLRNEEAVGSDPITSTTETASSQQLGSGALTVGKIPLRSVG
jgi:hypothetical protein